MAEIKRSRPGSGGSWEPVTCPASLKKKIVQTAVEDVAADLDEATGILSFVIRWTGGTHTRMQMPKPRSGVGRKADDADLEIIRKMGARYGDAEIARVLTKSGRKTAHGLRWSEERVRATRDKHGIEGRTETLADGEILTLAQAAEHAGVSNTTITALVRSGKLPMHQVAPWARWEIRKSDLAAEPVAGILRRLRRTGRLSLEGDDSEDQIPLFQ